RIPRHSDTQPTNIRTLVPRSFGQAVGAQRRRFALLV
ncbi:glutathione S-transferase, partial [Pseudomonas aeruginosa]